MGPDRVIRKGSGSPNRMVRHNIASFAFLGAIGFKGGFELGVW